MYDRVLPAISRLGKAFTHFGGRIAQCKGFVWTPQQTDKPVPDKDRKVIGRGGRRRRKELRKVKRMRNRKNQEERGKEKGKGKEEEEEQGKGKGKE